MPHVLITGAGRGIGLELATRYATAGWQVTATVRDRARAAALPDGVQAVELDVADDAAVAGLADAVTTPIDVLINNAGIYGTKPQTMADVDAAAWLDVFRVNAIAPFLLSRTLLQHLRAGSGKTIVTITSRMGSLSENDTGNAPMYRSSKAAVNMAMQCLSYEVAADGLGVLLVHPGWVRTDMGTASARLSTAESVTGIMALIEAFDPATRLAFRAWDGREIAW